MTTRRRFLTRTTAALAAPFILPSRRALAAEARGHSIRLGHIGVGGQGSGLLRNFLSVKGATSAAIADPYGSRREAAGELVKTAQGHSPKLHSDFRELLADDSIDAVIIATPDHWHVPIALAAARAGKQIYLEKPLGYTLAQNQALQKVIKEHNTVFQYGTQQRSQEITRRAIELVLNGYIGEVKEIHCWAPAGAGDGGSLEEIPVPDGLDYEMYIGPAPMNPCTKDRITSNASWFCSDYSLGFIAGWGAHPLDFSIWGQQHDQHGPVRFKGSGTFPSPGGLFDACNMWDVSVDFGGKVAMRFVSDNQAAQLAGSYLKNPGNNGTTFIGKDGWVCLKRGGAEASNPEWLRLRQCEGDRRVAYHRNYYQAFVEAVRDRTPTIAPIDDAVRSDALSHLSLLAIQSGKEIVWDPQAYRIISPEDLNAKMSHDIRGSWKQS